MQLMTDIHVRSFSGLSLKPYVHSLIKLRSEVLSDYPYFEELNPQEEMAYLRTIASCKEAVVVLIFDNTTLVGAAIGCPLSLESAEIQHPFKMKNLPISHYYFFGESLLLKPYRGRGIGHHFFDARESFASQLHTFRNLCFCTPTHLDSPAERPRDFVPMHDFWRKRGYIHHPEMLASIRQKKIDQVHPEQTHLSVWIKNLSE